MGNIVPGIPAGFTDYVVERRCSILMAWPGFCRSDADLLDVGCGNGAAMLFLHARFRACHGIDISAEHHAEFLKEAERRGVRNCTMSIGNICSDANAGRRFERALCFEVLEHVSDESAALRALYDHLAPRGLLAITVPNKWWIFETHGAHLPVLPWNRVPFFSWLPTVIHQRFAKARIYTKKRILTLLRGAGFRILDSFYVTAPMDRLRWKPLQGLLRRTAFRAHRTRLPILATSIMVIVDKDGGAGSERRARLRDTDCREFDR